MVSPFTLGLFAPLPLAMMIPFMATQSLAMGEAFGKSFQYGKRKISSMTNEEFNKLTFQNLMDEQTANIKTIIPKLHEQMADSKAMQEDIFREMTNLIPAFLKGLGAGATDVAKTLDEDFQDFLKNPTRAFQTDVSHTTEQANTQTVATVVNVSHDGKSTIEKPSETFTQDDPLKELTSFNKKIANWNRHTTETAISSGIYSGAELQALQDHLHDIKKFEGDFNIEIPEQKALTAQQTAQKAYLKQTISLQQPIIKFQGQINYWGTADYRKNNPQGTAQNVKDYTHKQLAIAKKKLQNYITQSRNNIQLKSVANRDWNDRIWNV